jgi:hypothetical protein
MAPLWQAHTGQVLVAWPLPEPTAGDLPGFRRWVESVTGLNPDKAGATLRAPGESDTTAATRSRGAYGPTALASDPHSPNACR